MDCIVYIDLFFLLSFWMNSLLVFAVRMLTKTYRTFRCIGSALLGAAGSSVALLVYFQTQRKELWLLFEAVVLLSMNLLAFGAKNLLWHMFLFVLAGMIVSGLNMQLLFLCNDADAVTIGMISVAAGVLCLILEKKGRVRWKEEHMKAKTVLTFADRKMCATALMDTGNRLYDPFYHKPVILVDEHLLRDIMSQCREQCPEKLQFIPFHSVGRQEGMLEGVMLDHVTLQWQEKKLQFEKVIAASTKESLYKGKEYQVIFHCGLLSDC